MFRCIVLFTPLLLLPLFLFAQDNVDDLFSLPDETITGSEEDDSNNTQSADDSEEEAGEGEEQINLAALTQSEPIVKGSVSLSGALVAGFKEWDFSTDGESLSAYYTMDSAFSVDVRPTSDFRFFSSVKVSFDQESLGISSPTVNELFVDYTLADTIFFRIGKQTLTWGQGNLQGQMIANPGNLVSDISDSVALKAFLPLANNGLTLVAYPGGTSTSPLDFAYAALFEASLGPLTFGISGKFQRTLDQALIADLYLKTAIAGFDLAVEARMDFDPFPERDGYLEPTIQAVSNIFLDSSIGIRLLGEYSFAYGPNVRVYTSGEEKVAEAGEHIIGLGFLLTSLFANDWRPGIRWFHHLSDGSGQVITGITGTIAPNLKADIAVPLIYGASGGYYPRENPDPGKRKLSLLLRFTLSTSF